MTKFNWVNEFDKIVKAIERAEDAGNYDKAEELTKELKWIQDNTEYHSQLKELLEDEEEELEPLTAEDIAEWKYGNDYDKFMK